MSYEETEAHLKATAILRGTFPTMFELMGEMTVNERDNFLICGIIGSTLRSFADDGWLELCLYHDGRKKCSRIGCTCQINGLMEALTALRHQAIEATEATRNNQK